MKMSEFKKLENAVLSLGKTIRDFPVGAVCIDDLRPIEEKIILIRESLKHLNSRVLRLKAKKETQSFRDEPKEYGEDMLDLIHTATAASIIHNKAVRLCLHSTTVESIFNEKEGDPEMQKKISSYMRDLFTFNDGIISMQQQIEAAIHKQLDLKIQCQKSLYDYHDFLKTQEEIRRKELQETNPEIARTKEKMEKAIRKINVMKRLITNLIAASSHMLKDKPFLYEMLVKHRELINVETILKISQNNVEKIA